MSGLWRPNFVPMWSQCFVPAPSRLYVPVLPCRRDWKYGPMSALIPETGARQPDREYAFRLPAFTIMIAEYHRARNISGRAKRQCAAITCS